MKSITISSETVSSKDELCSLLKNGLALPEYCGSNLDGIHDCLTEIFEDFEITVTVDEELKKALGGYYDGLIEMLSDLDRENKHLTLNIIY